MPLGMMNLSPIFLSIAEHNNYVAAVVPPVQVLVYKIHFFCLFCGNELWMLSDLLQKIKVFG